MSTKQKAQELVDKFKKYAYYPKTKDDEIFINQLNENAKECALIAVEELIEQENRYNNGSFYPSKYWTEVKEEIEKL